MLVELHCHSTHSDGSLRPADVTTRARERGVAVFSLTDHDTATGWDELAETWRGGPCVRGLELSCRHHGQTVHLLLYDRARDPDRWATMDERLLAIAQARRQRAVSICALLGERGLAIDAEHMLANTGSSTVGRPHVARALVAAGHVRSIQQAFTRYLYDGSPFDVPLERFTVQDGLDLAEQAGAVVSLAHPHSLGNGAAVLIEEFAPKGLSGLEVFYQAYSRGQRRHFAELARSHGLVATGGTDYHGDAMPKITGVGIEIPDDDGERLLRWLGF